MTTVESLPTGVLAWLIGTVAVVPGVLGAGIGLLGFPVVDLTTCLLLSVAVMATAVGATAAAALAVRRATV